MPLQVDYLDGADHRLPGRIGLCAAPGLAAHARDRDRMTREDVSALALRHGAKLLVSLVGRDECAAIGLNSLDDACRAADVEWRRVDLESGSTQDVEGASLVSLLEALERTLDVAKLSGTVLVHCVNGTERAPAFAACCLVARGMTPDAALARVRATRAGVLESGAAEAWVRRIAAELR